MRKKIKVDYFGITVPSKEEKVDPSTYSYKVRRADILGMIRLAGSPTALHPVKLSRLYGVSHTMICKDIKVLKQYLRENIGKDMLIKSDLKFNKIVNDLMKGTNADKYHAAKIIKDWNDFLFDSGVQKKTPIETKDVTDETLEESFTRFNEMREQWEKAN